MKALYFTGFLILINAVLFAQSSKKISLQAWIKQKGYIALTDNDHLPNSMAPYYTVIKDSVVKNHSRFKSFPDFSTSYILAKGIGNTKTLFSVTIFPLSALKLMKHYEGKQTPSKYDPKTKMHTQILDDFGGSAGEVILKLDKATGKMSFYNTQ